MVGLSWGLWRARDTEFMIKVELGLYLHDEDLDEDGKPYGDHRGLERRNFFKSGRGFKKTSNSARIRPRQNMEKTFLPALRRVLAAFLGGA